MQQPLDEDERAFRDLFCYEYLKDHDSFSAALRAGMIREVAMAYSYQLLHDPYVQQKIDQLKRNLPDNPSALLPHNQRKVEQLLWELAYDKSEKSSHSARVTAAMGLARIHKMIANEDENAAASKMDALAQLFREFAKTAPV
jgi:3-dehydroquinate synthetase